MTREYRIAYPTFALALPPAGTRVRTVVPMTSTPPLDPSGQHRSDRSFKSRTSLVTAAAIAGVLLAGTAAVAANIGILNAADSSAIGDLAATDELLPVAGAGIPTVKVEAPEAPTTTTTMPPASGAQQYDIEDAGTVWIMTTTSGLALDHVVAEPDWNSTLSQGDPRSLQVDFTNGTRTIVFTAVLADDGSVAVDVTEPTTVVAPAPANAVAPPVAGGYDDDDSYVDDSYDDHDSYEDESDDDDSYVEHDGADDDD